MFQKGSRRSPYYRMKRYVRGHGAPCKKLPLTLLYCACVSWVLIFVWHFQKSYHVCQSQPTKVVIPRSLYTPTDSTDEMVPVMSKEETIPVMSKEAMAMVPVMSKEDQNKSEAKCPRNQKRVTYNACPQCFRPNIKYVEKILEQIDPSHTRLQNPAKNYFKPRDHIVQNLTTSYLISPTFINPRECPYVLAVQPSVAKARVGRKAVRETWASVARGREWPYRRLNAEIKIIFVLAEQNVIQNTGGVNVSKPITQWKEVLKEAQEYNDILFLDMIDDYRNLTLKLLSAFKWVKDNCPCVKFVLKVDQDTFVNVPLLVDTLLYFEDRLNFSVAGQLYGSNYGMNIVRRRTRWAISEELYPMKFYPPYASGCGYLLHNSVLSKIVDYAPYFPILPIEDAFITGILGKAIGCKIFNFHNSTFTDYFEQAWSTCKMLQDKKILGTKMTIEKHYKMWNSFQSNQTCP